MGTLYDLTKENLDILLKRRIEEIKDELENRKAKLNRDIEDTGGRNFYIKSLTHIDDKLPIKQIIEEILTIDRCKRGAKVELDSVKALEEELFGDILYD